MSQRILQPGEIEALDRTAFPRIILPQPATRLRERAARLRHLAEGSPMGPFLRYLARLVDAQHAALDAVPDMPQPDAERIDRAQRHAMPLWQLPADIDPAWKAVMRAIVQHLQQGPGAEEANDVERQVLAELQALDDAALGHLLASLWSNEHLNDSQRVRAPVVMAAVQVVMMSRAARLDLKTLPFVDPPTICPVCSSSPLASVVHIGGQEEGLRYLHCSICETEWHMVRVKCSNCASTEGISYRRLESVDTPLMSREDLVKNPMVGAQRAAVPCMAELCGKCGCYSKIFDMRKDPTIEVLADDLGTLMLDMMMGQDGHPRAGLLRRLRNRRPRGTGPAGHGPGGQDTGRSARPGPRLTRGHWNRRTDHDLPHGSGAPQPRRFDRAASRTARHHHCPGTGDSRPGCNDGVWHHRRLVLPRP